MKTRSYRWIVEEREVPRLDRILCNGDVFDAPEELGAQLVAQGCAELEKIAMSTKKATPRSRTRRQSKATPSAGPPESSKQAERAAAAPFETKQ